MSTKKPLICTYCFDIDSVALALSSGAEVLILETALLSLRSGSKHTSFTILTEMALYARKICPEVVLWASVDILLHERHFLLLPSFIASLQEASISTILIQDVALIEYFSIHLPSASLVFASETGNSNFISVSAFSERVSIQFLNNELPFSSLLSFSNALPHYAFGIQVQGPLLLQYSVRKFLHGHRLHDDLEIPLSVVAQDKQYKGRYFRFHENRHGHFMFASFDRSLLNYIPDLFKLNLSYWVVDCRLESLNYLQTCVSLYAQAKALYLKDPSSFKIPSDWKSMLQLVSNRPQKAGFFRANQTDQIRESKSALTSSEFYPVGVACDVESGKRVTLRLDSPLCVGDELVLRSPRKKEIFFTLTHLWDLENNSLLDSLNHQFVRISWIPSCDSKSVVYKRIYDSNL